jgi:hypothetical protein
MNNPESIATWGTQDSGDEGKKRKPPTMGKQLVNFITCDLIFVKIYSKFDVKKQKLSLNRKKIKAIKRKIMLK